MEKSLAIPASIASSRRGFMGSVLLRLRALLGPDVVEENTQESQNRMVAWLRQVRAEKEVFGVLGEYLSPAKFDRYFWHEMRDAIGRGATVRILCYPGGAPLDAGVPDGCEVTPLHRPPQHEFVVVDRRSVFVDPSHGDVVGSHLSYVDYHVPDLAGLLASRFERIRQQESAAA